MEVIDDNYQLYFKLKSGFTINVNKKFLSQIKESDKSSLPENTKIVMSSGPFYEIYFQDGTNFIIYYYPIKCIFTISNTIKEIFLYSFIHLKLILDKLRKEYKNPYFYSKCYEKNIYLNENDLKEIDFSFETSIEIKEQDEEEFNEKIKEIFKDIQDTYSTKNPPTYKFISPNFNIYFPKVISNELTNEFKYIYSDKRQLLELKFRLFFFKSSEKIFPICGPHNIGKTITAMRIQKSYYSKGIKSLYLNIKYYFYEPLKDCDKKIDTLIKECVYFIETA